MAKKISVSSIQNVASKVFVQLIYIRCYPMWENLNCLSINIWLKGLVLSQNGSNVCFHKQLIIITKKRALSNQTTEGKSHLVRREVTFELFIIDSLKISSTSRVWGISHVYIFVVSLFNITKFHYYHSIL